VILYLVRHCRTDYNDQRRCQGTTDLPLNEAGKREAEALGRRFGAMEIDAFHSSPMIRAMETAYAMSPGRKIDIKPEPGLVELNQGELEGMDMGEMARNYPEVLKNWIEDPTDTHLPGGETMRQLQQRIWGTVKTIARSYPPEARVAAISHNLALCTVVCKLLKIEIKDFRRFKISPASVTVVDFRSGSPVLLALNDTSHLDGIEF